jgi:branched-chain amino acid transport system permease protein
LGIMLRASRDEHTAARACGARIFRYRVIAFTISTFFAGIAGVLLGHRIGTISVATFYLDLTFMLLAMVVVGGLRSMSGVLLGVIIVSLVMEVLRTFQTGVTIGGQPFSIPAGSVQIGIALVMILMLRLRPEGILKGLELDVGSWFRRNAPARVIRGADSGAPAAE